MANARASRVTPEQAQTLLDSGYVYVDVRSTGEYEAGHPPGAFNVPFQHLVDGDWVTNESFLPAMQAHFTPEARLVLGCRCGARSQRALELLTRAGYTQVVDLATGWEGRRDAFGRMQPGWSRVGLAVETGQPAERCWESLNPQP